MVKNPPAKAGDSRDVGPFPGSGRSPGIEDGNPLQHSCLENSMDRGDWQATVRGVAKESDMTEQLSVRTYAHIHTHTLCFQTQTFVFCILPSTLCIVWSPSMREAKPRSKESAKRNPCLTQILSTFTFLSWMIPPKEFFHNTPVLGHTCCCPAPLPFHFSHLSLKIYIFRFLVHVHSERICDS